MNVALFPELVVNGQRVPRSLVAAEAQNHAAPPGKPGIAWRQAARAIAMRTLLLQEAARRGLTPEPAELAPGRFETDDEALVRALLETAVQVSPPTEAEVQARWASDPGRYRAPPLWQVSHILIACDPRDETARGAAHRRASDLASELRADPASFARLAARHSDCPSRASGGLLGQIGPGDSVPEFEVTLPNLRPGEITATPVLTRHGWHVIRLDAVAQGAPLPYRTVGPKLAEAMEKAAWMHAARAFIDALVRGADIQGADMLGPAEDPPC